MKKSERTKECIKKKWFYRFLSWFLCFGVMVLLVGYGFMTKWSASSENSVIAKQIKGLLITVSLSLVPLIIISLSVKDNIKPTVRMVNVILAAYLVSNWFMYVIGAVMLIDTYFISTKSQTYKIKAEANKEIDLRG